MTPNPYWPKFLRSPDPEHTPATFEDYCRRARYAYDALVRENPPIVLNEGTPYAEPFSMDLAMQWASRLADEELS